MTAPAPDRHEVRCKHCKKALGDHPPVELPPNAWPAGKAAKLHTSIITNQVKHLAQDHPEIWRSGMDFYQEGLRYFLIASQFEDTDPQLSERIETIRALLLQTCRRPAPTDADLEEAVIRLEINPKDAPKVLQALKNLRALL